MQAAEKERLGYESSISEMKVTLENQKMEIVDLYAKSAELESVKIQLGREMEKCAAKVNMCFFVDTPLSLGGWGGVKLVLMIFPLFSILNPPSSQGAPNQDFSVTSKMYCNY